MPSNVTLDTAELAGLSLEFLLYGCYLVLFFQSQQLLFFSSNSTRAKGTSILGVASVLLFVFTTAHFAIDVARLFDAFIKFRDEGPALYLGTLANPKNVAKTACYVVQTCIGDLIMVYRVYVVYGKKLWIVVFPLIMIGGLLATGISITVKFTRFNIHEEIFESDTGHWILSWFSVTLLSTSCNTSLIAYRIWTVDRKIRSATNRGSLTPVIQILVESAAIYCALLAFTLFSYVAKSNIQFIGLDMTSPTIGIVFTLMIVRLYNGGRGTHNTGSQSGNDGPHPLRGLNVTINTVTQVDRDDATDYKLGMRSGSDRVKSYGRQIPEPWSDSHSDDA